MTRKATEEPPFPRAVAAASAFLMSAGAFLLAAGLGWIGVWLYDPAPLPRAIAIGEGLFLIGLGLLPVVLWLAARKQGRAHGRPHRQTV